MKKFLLPLVAAAAVLLPATGFSAPLNKTQVSATAKWVFHVDFEAFHASQIGQLVKQEVKAQHQAKLDAMKQLLGSDLTADINGLTVFGPDANEANATALIYGTFNREKLLGLLVLNSAYAESTYGDQKLYHWQDDHHGKNQVGAFAANNLIIISQTEGSVKAALDVLAGQGVSLAANKGTPLYSLTEGTQGAFVVAAANGLSELTQDKNHAAILQNSKMIATFADETEGNLRLFVQLEANNAEAAQQVEQVARGMLAFASLQQQKHPELTPLIGACNLARTESQIKFEFRYPSEKLFELIKTFTPHKALLEM